MIEREELRKKIKAVREKKRKLGFEYLCIKELEEVPLILEWQKLSIKS